MSKLSSPLFFVLILCLLTILGIFSTSIYLPSFPSIAKSFGTSQESVQITLTIFFLGSVTGNLLLGYFSDQTGRLFVAKWGLIIFIISSFLCAEAQTLLIFQISRFFQGLASSAGALTARAVSRDLYDGSDLVKLSATIMIAVYFSLAIAPTLGGIIDFYFGWEKNFYLLTFFGFFVSFVVWMWMPETNKYKKIPFDSSSTFKNYIILLKDPHYIIFCLVIWAQMGAGFCYIALSPYIFIIFFNLLPQEYGYVGIASAFGNIIGFVLARQMACYLDFHEGILIGSFLCLIISLIFVIICFFFPIKFYLLILYIICFFTFSALAIVNASAGAMNLFSHMAGTSSAMVGTIQMASGVFGCSLASIIPFSPLVLGLTIGGLSFLSCMGGLHIKKRKKNSEDSYFKFRNKKLKGLA